MNPLEALGQLYLDHQRLHVEYGNLLMLITRIQSGEVNVSDVAILPGNNWEIRSKPVTDEQG